MEIRVEKRRANDEEESPNDDTNAISKFNLHNFQVKRSLDFGHEVKVIKHFHIFFSLYWLLELHIP
jgi:hypothetical protein